MLVLILAVSFFLKASEVAGADAEFSVEKRLSTPFYLALNDIEIENLSENPDQSLAATTVAPSDSVTQEILAAEQATAPPPDPTMTLVSTNDVSQSTSGVSAGTATTQIQATSSPSKAVSLIPMVGGAFYQNTNRYNNWSDHITNNHTFGLALDIPITQKLSFELEGARGDYDISYGLYDNYGNFSNRYVYHSFQVYSLGGNLKLFPLNHAIFQPFLGLGMLGMWFQNINGYNLNDPFVGSGQLMAGSDFVVSEGWALGIRGAWIVPMFNKPDAFSNVYGNTSAQGFEEASAVNSNFFRLLGTLRVDL